MKAGWQTKTLGDVCEFQRGLTYAKGDEVDVSDNIVLRAMNIDLATNLLDFSELKYISDEIAIPENKKVKAGSLMICTASGSKLHLGKVAYIDGDYGYAFGGFMGMVTPKHELHPKFLFHLMTSPDYKDFIATLSDGANINNLKFDDLRKFVVPLPPLPEQQRIVAILDEAFDGIAVARANAEQNLQNARALFESHLQSVFTQRGEGWEEKPFEELIESNVIGLTKNSREQGEDKAYPYVKMNNITRDNRFDFSSFTCVDATGEEVSKFSLRDGDFLFNTRNSYELVGKSCIYESDSDDLVLFNNNIMRVRFKGGVDARFVLLAFSSKAVADELNSLKSGTTNVSAIYFKDLKSLPISIPPIEAQKAISAQLKLLAIETQHLESLYQCKLAALDELKKSLLHQAFSGML
ncbi:restriction endonuclease subunit S [Ferrigenium sp. UT5]|uniref:restriction endonuclease subunit S n=1 Tax=Ferrigenium sp. UT5 TaxID=3242105 RepID=UPI003553C2D9